MTLQYLAMVKPYPCLKVASELNKLGQSCRVVNVHTIKPLETEMIAILEKTKHAVVVEEHNSYGGLGSIVAQIAAEYCPTKINFITNDKFGLTGLRVKYLIILIELQ